jgi:hypothetical protein
MSETLLAAAAAAASDAPDAAALARGAARLLADMGFSAVAEAVLGNGRRADLLGLDRGGRIAIVEIKTSVADFRADRKWLDYLAFCDLFYFAVPEAFPRDLVPATTGLIVADRFGGAVLRMAEERALPPARRRSLTLAVARQAAERLRRLSDPAA